MAALSINVFKISLKVFKIFRIEEQKEQINIKEKIKEVMRNYMVTKTKKKILHSTYNLISVEQK